MASVDQLVINVDGAARGNPGPAAYGFVFSVDGQSIFEEGGALGEATNNVAEYTALVKALEKAETFQPKEILIRSDSELMVKQMNGVYKVKNENLKPLHEQARQLALKYGRVRYSHIPREQNKEADRLCNETLDGRRLGASKAVATRKEAAPKPATEMKEYVKVEMQGKLRNDHVAIGGETTGIIIEVNGNSWELDLSGTLSGPSKAKQLAGQLVKVKGTLWLREGAETGGRWIVRVESLLEVA